jgi:ABC-type antimicrobial peptide transport system permease subunit
MFQPGVNPEMDIAVRASGDPELLRSAIRAEMRTLDPAAPPYGIVTVEQRLAETVASRRLQTMLSGALAIITLVLSVIGAYGVIHQSVATRTQEIGIRMAMGAPTATVLRMILRGGLGPAVAGLILGLLGAMVLSRALSSFLYETSPLDPAIYVGVAVLLLAVTTAACLVPAVRAAQVDPMVALRHE